MKSKTILIWVSTLLVLTHFSCKKETGPVGLNVGDNNIGLQLIDTFTLITTTVKEDSLITSNLTYNLLGAINSTEYGNAEASLYYNFVLPQAGFSFGSSPQIDSVVLVLPYLGGNNYSGDLSDNQNIVVYEMNERLRADSNYYSSRVFASSASSSGTFTGIFNINDSVQLIEKGVAVKYAPHLRISLGGGIAARFTNATAPDLSSNSAFQDYLKGVYVEAKNTGLGLNDGSVAYFNLTTAISGLTVYYNDSLKVVFPVSSSESARVNRYRHDFNAATVNNQLQNPQDYPETYLQSMSGLKTKIEIPGLLNLVKDKSLAIANASLEFYYDKSFTSQNFRPFSRLLLMKRDSLGRNAVVYDLFFEPATYGGTLDSIDSKYKFNVTREIQQILNASRSMGSNWNTGFYLIPPTDKPVTASRLRMDTGKGTARGIKLKVSIVKSD